MADLSELIAWCRTEARRQRDFSDTGETVRQRRRSFHRAKMFDQIGDKLGKYKRLCGDKQP